MMMDDQDDRNEDDNPFKAYYKRLDDIADELDLQRTDLHTEFTKYTDTLKMNPDVALQYMIDRHYQRSSINITGV